MKKKSVFLKIATWLSYLLIVQLNILPAQENVKYDKVFTYCEGIAVVEKGNKSGYINENGKEITPIKYDRAYWFKGGIAKVNINGKFGFIDASGTEIIPVIYDEVEEFSDKTWIMVRLGDKFGIADKTGIITEPKYDIGKGSFNENMIIVKQNDKYGYVSYITGKEITPIKYDIALPFKSEIALVSINRKVGYIDKTGKEITPIKYDRGEEFIVDREWVQVEIGDKVGIVSKTGEVTTPKYDDIWEQKEGVCVVKQNGKYGLIDNLTGQEIIPCKYDAIANFKEGFARGKLDGKWEYFDKTGKELTPCIYEETMDFYEGYAGVKENGKWGGIDKTGREVINCKYDAIGVFSEGMARVKRGEKWGYIDNTGKEIISCKYDDAWDFSNGVAKVYVKGENWDRPYEIDKQGEFYVPYVDPEGF